MFFILFLLISLLLFHSFRSIIYGVEWINGWMEIICNYCLLELITKEWVRVIVMLWHQSEIITQPDLNKKIPILNPSSMIIRSFLSIKSCSEKNPHIINNMNWWSIIRSNRQQHRWWLEIIILFCCQNQWLLLEPHFEFDWDSYTGQYRQQWYNGHIFNKIQF